MQNSFTLGPCVNARVSRLGICVIQILRFSKFDEPSERIRHSSLKNVSDRHQNNEQIFSAFEMQINRCSVDEAYVKLRVLGNPMFLNGPFLRNDRTDFIQVWADREFNESNN